MINNTKTITVLLYEDENGEKEEMTFRIKLFNCKEGFKYFNELINLFKDFQITKDKEVNIEKVVEPLMHLAIPINKETGQSLIGNEIFTLEKAYTITI